MLKNIWMNIFRISELLHESPWVEYHPGGWGIFSGAFAVRIEPSVDEGYLAELQTRNRNSPHQNDLSRVALHAENSAFRSP
jgi:hypothetical protein